MSGTALCQALNERFDVIRRRELDRLEKKLRSLAEHDRREVEAITAHVIQAIAVAPARVLGDDIPAPTLEALARLFQLQVDETTPTR